LPDATLAGAATFGGTWKPPATANRVGKDIRGQSTGLAAISAVDYGQPAPSDVRCQSIAESTSTSDGRLAHRGTVAANATAGGRDPGIPVLQSIHRATRPVITVND